MCEIPPPGAAAVTPLGSLRAFELRAAMLELGTGRLRGPGRAALRIAPKMPRRRGRVLPRCARPLETDSDGLVFLGLGIERAV